VHAEPPLELLLPLLLPEPEDPLDALLPAPPEPLLDPPLLDPPPPPPLPLDVLDSPEELLLPELLPPKAPPPPLPDPACVLAPPAPQPGGGASLEHPLAKARIAQPHVARMSARSCNFRS
jgi:protein TonB